MRVVSSDVAAPPGASHTPGMSLTSPVTDLRVSITRVTAAASHSSVSTPHLASEDPRPKFKVSLRIIRGLGLIAADQTGSSDPYCVISAAEGSRTLQTKIIQQCLDPVWDEQFDFLVSPDECYLTIDVWDSDLSQDDFLGRCMIALPMFSTPTTRSFPLRRAAADDVVSGWGPALDAQLHSLCFKYGFFESISIGSDASSYQSLQNQPAVRRVPTFSVSAPVVALSRTRSRPAMFDSSSSTSQPADGDDEFDIVDRTSVMEKSTVFGRIPVASTPMASEAGPEFDFGADSQPITHMPGCFEKVELHLDQAVLSISGFSIHGRVFLTNFRLIFLPEELFVAESRVSVPDDSSPQNRFDPQFCIVLPFGMLLGVEQSFDSTSFRTPATVIQVQAADFRAFKLMFAHQHHPARVVSLMFRRLRFLSTNPDAPVAFDFIDEFLSRSARVNLSGGHVPFSMSAEMSRLKLPMDLYRMTTLNEHYALCPTYPSELFVPIQFSDAALVDSVKFRSAQRFPVVCWYNAVHGNVMCRSAQPQPGLVSRVNRNDEELIAAYTANTKKLNSEASYFQVFDARSNLAATGNSIAGKGTENMARYANCRIRFLELGNIHTMRASFDALRNMCLSAVSESNWFSALQQSGWLENVRCIINAASTIAQLMHERGVSVLVHCSDGWDRTSQLTSLVQLFMDPYYRTIDGFVTLIEKEWLAFGHMFRKRNGVPEAPDERSPIFAQWLDCVWQCLKQNPDAFEFNEALLLLLADHLRSGWFGTFLMDCERERRAPELRLADRTVSLWVLISEASGGRQRYRHSHYCPSTDLLSPIASNKVLQLWAANYLRYDEIMFRHSVTLDREDVLRSSSVSERRQSRLVLWMPDTSATECTACKLAFTFFRRRHHCRACGQIYCGDCIAGTKSLEHLGYDTPQKVCERCLRQDLEIASPSGPSAQPQLEVESAPVPIVRSKAAPAAAIAHSESPHDSVDPAWLSPVDPSKRVRERRRSTRGSVLIASSLPPEPVLRSE